jgi:hypothetical protein
MQELCTLFFIRERKEKLCSVVDEFQSNGCFAHPLRALLSGPEQGLPLSLLDLRVRLGARSR